MPKNKTWYCLLTIVVAIGALRYLSSCLGGNNCQGDPNATPCDPVVSYPIELFQLDHTDSVVQVVVNVFKSVQKIKLFACSCKDNDGPPSREQIMDLDQTIDITICYARDGSLADFDIEKFSHVANSEFVIERKNREWIGGSVSNEKSTKRFVLLADGKIVAENDPVKDTYWAALRSCLHE